MNQFLYDAIAFVLRDTPLAMLILALVLGTLRWALFGKKRRNISMPEAFLRPLFVLAVGVSGFWGAYWHGLHPAETAAFIGWKPSPFQWEVAMANLAMGVCGLLCWRASRSFRLATAVMVVCFLWGAAVGHVRQMIEAGNFAPGNAGAIFYTDLLIPLLCLAFLAFQRKPGNSLLIQRDKLS